MKSIVIQLGKESEQIEIVVHGYERPDSTDYYDANWLSCEVSVAVGKFRGETRCALWTVDFHSFAKSLRELESNLAGSAEFTTMEEQLTLSLKGDGLGHFELVGEVIDRPGRGNGNCLRWRFDVDQVQLDDFRRQIQRVVSTFPVRGS